MSLDLTPEFRHTLDLLDRGDHHLFITGRAGTGKSTLLQHFRTVTQKNVVVLAPTGVAAVNVSGETIHSFFGFRPDITPDRVKKLSPGKQALYKKIDTLVIDEISMTRADLLDAAARFLQLNGRAPGKPFGGVQMVLFGDLYQLPPVVQNRERELFQGYYESPYFFSAKSFDALRPEWIELTKVFRQRDEDFLEILNRIRNNTVLDSDLDRLNARVRDEIDASILDEYVFLTTTNEGARAINRHQLDRLRGRKHAFTATVEGDFDATSFPTDSELELKEDAQVMLLNNDSQGRWINGTIGKIKKIDAPNDTLTVTLPDGSSEEVGPYQWEMFHFELDKTTHRVTPVPIGRFVQFPVRLAWAMTIHKSQGLTFDKVVIDLSRGTFAHGQLYVGLSRLRTLAGLILTRPVKKGHILLDRQIQKFITGYQYGLAEERRPLATRIRAIQEAIEEGHDLDIVYLKQSDEKSRRRITPISVSEMEFQNKSFPGLKAYCHTRKDERTFRVDRILELKTVEG